MSELPNMAMIAAAAAAGAGPNSPLAANIAALMQNPSFVSNMYSALAQNQHFLRQQQMMMHQQQYYAQQQQQGGGQPAAGDDAGAAAAAAAAGAGLHDPAAAGGEGSPQPQPGMLGGDPRFLGMMHQKLQQEQSGVPGAALQAPLPEPGGPYNFADAGAGADFPLPFDDNQGPRVAGPIAVATTGDAETLLALRESSPSPSPSP